MIKKESLKCLVIVILVGFLAIALNAEANVKEGYIEFQGGRTWYKMVSTEEGTGVPLIAVHGGPGFPHNYLMPLAKLADDRPVIFYDQRGCGKSDPLENPADWNTEFFVEELNQLILQLGLDQFHLLGQSWGTMVSTDFVLAHQPKGMVSLILASPPLSMPLWYADGRRLTETLPEDVQDTIYWHEDNLVFDTPEYEEAVLVYYSYFLIQLDPWPELVNQSMAGMNNDIYHYMWGASEFTANGTLQDYDRTPYLNQIQTPTLLTCGKYDEATPSTVGYYHSLFPNSEFKVFNKSAHMAHLEQEHHFLQEIRKFVRKCERKQ